jgi:DNA-binding transcriptional regulator GbsR (MarR family)
MGTRWGINRTVAQIHALLFVSDRPLLAEEIADTLSVARSNVSTSLRELTAWGLVRITHALGDRRDFFETQKDVGQMFQIIIEGRKRREIDPTLALLREAAAEPDSPGHQDDYARARLAELREFFEVTTSWYDEMRRLPEPVLRRLLKMGGRIASLLGKGSK